MTTNPEVLRLARQCIVEALGCPKDEAWVDEFLKKVSADLIAITVLAIEKTTELSAAHVRQNAPVIQCMSVEPVVTALFETAIEIDRYDHLRQSEKDNSDAD